MSDLPPLPPGFVLDKPVSGGDLPPLPPGFVLDAPAAANPTEKPGFGERLWSGGLKTAGQMATVVPRLAQGAVEGVIGEGIPKGPASQFEGGPGRFLGRGLGAGARSVAESLWEGIIKAPGKMLTGAMQPGPEAEAAARGTALATAGIGRSIVPPRTAPTRLATEAEPAFPRPATVQPGEGPQLIYRPGETVDRPKAVQPGQGPTELTPAATGSAAPIPEPAVSPSAPGAAIGAAIAEPIRNPRADAATAALYREAVHPGVRGRRDATQLAAQDRNIASGVDSIIENKPNLKLTDTRGTELPPGTAPRNMRQFSEAIEQTKTGLFEKWNPLAARAGEEGLRIDLAPVVGELRSLATKPEVAHVNPAVVSQLDRFAEIYEKQGAYTPLEAQHVITGINRRLAAFYEKGEAASGAPAEVLEPVARLLRKQLDEGIEATVAPGYQALRREYGALSAIEGEVTKAAQRIANKPNSGLSKLANLVSSTEFVHGVLMLNPNAIARAIGAKSAGELHRFFNDPNRMIAKLFDKRGATPLTPGFGNLPGVAARAGAIGIGDFQSGGFPSMPRTSVGGP